MRRGRRLLLVAGVVTGAFKTGAIAELFYPGADTAEVRPHPRSLVPARVRHLVKPGESHATEL